MVPSSVRILYLDDVEDWRLQVGNLLRERGFEVMAVATAHDALFHLQNAVFDLAIIDMRLDESDEKNIDGVLLVEQARASGCVVPIVVLTAFEHAIPPDYALRLTRDPHVCRILTKNDINQGGQDDLLVQIDLLIPWQQRTIRAMTIMPFHRDFDDVYQGISDSCTRLGIDCERVDQDTRAGYIPERIRQHLRACHLVIADVTGLRPNVFYELGYAQALAKPTVLICQYSQELPANVSAQHTIFYDTTYVGIRSLTERLEASIKQTLDAPQVAHRRRNLPERTNTYAGFLPATDAGQAAYHNVVERVVSDLNLAPLVSYRTEAVARVIDEDLDHIQQATVIIGDISDGDPRVYFNIGAADALRSTGVFLLVRRSISPPFNLRERANVVEYDVENRGAIRAQKNLTARIREFLNAARTRAIEEMPPVSGFDPADARYRSWREIRQCRDQALRNIEAFAQRTWTAEERPSYEPALRQAVQWVNQTAEAVHLAVQRATTPVALQRVERDLKFLCANWHEDALRASGLLADDAS